MDYKAIYYKIIENAKKETDNGHRQLGYFEKHHIQPKSLGGTNNKENLVKLTAREHFICHWLLVKMYNKGTIERNKMLCALWKMQSISNTHKRYINARAYEALRIEFAKMISERASIYQQGKNNSQFGTKWYTNRNTGESKKFKEKPVEDFWIEGRNLFNGSELWSIITKHKCSLKNIDISLEYYTYCKKNNIVDNKRINYNTINPKIWEERKNIILNSNVNLQKRGWIKLVSEKTGLSYLIIKKTLLHFPELLNNVYLKKHNNIENINRLNFEEFKNYRKTIAEKQAQKLWNEYHKGNYKSLREFDCGKTIEALTRQFRKNIPIYNKLIKRRCLFPSNRDLIGVYE